VRLPTIRHVPVQRRRGHVWIFLVLASCGGTSVSNDPVVVDATVTVADAAVIETSNVPDASVTVQPPPPAMDASPKLEAAADATACAPQPVDSARLTWKPPKAPTLGVCTDKQISDQWSQCEDTTTLNRALCDAFDRDAQNTACLNCLFSTADESKYGPLYYLSDTKRDYNYAGCMVLQDGDSSATSCGAKIQATRHCANESCAAVCPVPSEYSA